MKAQHLILLRSRTSLMNDAKRFLCAALVNNILTITAYQILLFALPSPLAYAITWILGIGFVAVVYPSYVFANEKHSTGARLTTISIYLVGFCIGVGLTVLFDVVFDKDRLAIFATLGVTTLFNFFATRAVLRGRKGGQL
jgi:hypothetical protein